MLSVLLSPRLSGSPVARGWLLALLLSWLCLGSAAAQTVTSDKDDYAPGEVAIITGAGWTQDQAVHVEFKEEPDYPDYHTYDVAVDAQGSWEIRYNVEQRHLGVKFTVTAVGKQSGTVATTIFTDGFKTALAVDPGTGTYGGSITLKATLTQASGQGNGSAVIGKKISFSLNGSSVGTVATTTAGVASLTVSIPGTIAPATYANGISASFVGDDIYDSSTGTGALTINKIPTALAVDAASGTAGGTVSLKATLTTSGASFSGKLVTFSLNNSVVGSATTNGGGVATLNANLGAIAAGSYSGGVTASYAGETNYASSSGSAGLTVAPAISATSLTVANVTGTYGGTASFSATLKSGNVNLTSKTVSFTLNGAAVGSATTNASGVATLNNVSLAGINAAPTAYAGYVGASFAAETGYAASTGTGSLTINKADQSLTLVTPPPTSAGYGTSFTTQATASSGLPVTYAATAPLMGPASAADPTFTMNSGVGAAQITYTQAGNQNYNPAPPLSRSVAAAKAEATVQVVGYTGPYDGAAHGATGAATGLNNADLSSRLALGASFTDYPGGVAEWTFDGGDNYLSRAGTVAITISKASNTISFTKPADQTYAPGKTVGLEASASSGLPVAFGVVSGPATSSGNTLILTGAGTVQVQATQPGNNNYAAAAPVTHTLSVAKASQTIEFAALADKTFGDANVTLTASASSGLPVHFTATGAAQLLPDGRTLHITGAGGVTVTASQAGSDDYLPAASVVRTFPVAKAPATLSLSHLVQTYSGAALAATAATSPVGLEGVLVRYSQAGTPVATPTEAGDYAVEATLNNANYAAAPVTGTFRIEKALATVTLADLVQTYSGSARTVTATTSATGASTFTITYEGAPAAPVNAGQYAVVATLHNQNFVGSAQGTLEIRKATASLVFGTSTFTYDGTAKAVAVATTPAGLVGVAVTYAGSGAAPTNAGEYALAAQLTNANYEAPAITGTLVINKASQTITWPAPAAITYGAPLSATQLNATVAVVGPAPAGALSYSPALGTVLGAGPRELTVTAAATPNYEPAEARVTLQVNKAEQVIAWPTPAAITYGAALSSAQLNASVTTGDGPLTYAPALGSILAAGAQVLSVTAAETDNFTATTRTVGLNVSKGAQTITWEAPAALVYGTPLSATQLNATVTGSGPAATGAASYSPGLNTVLNAGTHTLTYSVAATSNYEAASKSVQVQVNKAEQVLTWASPAAITYGTALGIAQLNATVTGVAGGSAPGALTYTPAAGTVLGAGEHTLRVTAAATSNYLAASQEVQLPVNQAQPSLTWAALAPVTYGTTLSGKLNATASFNGTPVAGTFVYKMENVVVTEATLPDAATYALSVTFTPTDAANYLGATATNSLQVKKAAPSVTAVGGTFTYDGNEHGGSGSATGIGTPAVVLTPVTLEYKGTSAAGVAYGPSATAPVNAGTYTVTATFAGNTNYAAATSPAAALVISPRAASPVADTYYTGPSFYWTANSSSSNATLNLTATLRDNFNLGTSNGDIRTARVSFYVRSAGGGLTPINGAQNLPVGLVNATDKTVGTAAANVQYSISGSAAILNIAVVVSGNYSANDVATDNLIEIAVPTPGGLIVGCGTLNNETSAGYVKGAVLKNSAGTEVLRTQFAFNVQYSKSLKNPQGAVELTVKSYNDRLGNPTATLHLYKLKSNAISLLSTTSPTAQFSGKANIAEIVNGVEQSIEGNCTMQLDLLDGNPDQLAVTVYRSSGGIWYSNNWDGAKTLRKALASGSVSVSGSGAATLTATATSQSVAAEAPALAPAAPETGALLEVYPNPLVGQATVHFRAQQAGKVQVLVFDAQGRQVATLYEGTAGAGEEQYLDFARNNLPNGFYFFRLLTNGRVESKRISLTSAQ